MIHTLDFECDKHLSGITSKHIRSGVLSVLDGKISKEQMDKILFHLTDEEFKDKNSRKIPHICFGKPHRFHFTLKAFNDDGMELLLQIKKHLQSAKKLNFKGKAFSIVKVNLYSHPLVPETARETITYRTITPIILFRNNRRKIYDAILNKYKDDIKKRDEVFQEAIEKMLIANLKNLMCTFFKKKNYSVFDDITFHWKTMKIIMITDRNVKTPAIVGEFETDWELPHLIGNRIGAGFGHIMKQLPENKKEKNKKTKAIYKNGSAWSKLFTVLPIINKIIAKDGK